MQRTTGMHPREEKEGRLRRGRPAHLLGLDWSDSFLQIFAIFQLRSRGWSEQRSAESASYGNLQASAGIAPLPGGKQLGPIELTDLG